MITGILAVSAIYQFDLTTKDIKRNGTLVTDLYRLKLTLVDIETGQRGYIITDDDRYLDVYYKGLNRIQTEITDLRQDVQRNDVSTQKELQTVIALVTPKLVEMAKTIDLRHRSFEAARDEVDTHLGRNLMVTFLDDIDGLITVREQQITKLINSNALLARLVIVFFSGTLLIFLFFPLGCPTFRN